MNRDIERFLRRAARAPRPPSKTEPDASDYLKIALGHAPDVEQVPEPELPTRGRTDAKAGANTPTPPPKAPSANDLLRWLTAR